MQVLVEREGGFFLVGTVETVSGSGERFTYDDTWRGDPSAKPLSLSLPLRQESFEARVMRPYFEGLLPESAARASAARHLHVSSEAYLKLLAAMGDECLGAVMMLEEGRAHPKPSYLRVEEAELHQLAHEGYPKSSEFSLVSRLSLAGAQAKVGLYWDECTQRWFQPLGTAPSTHIVKPPNKRFSSMVENELFCLRLARVCGLAVCEAFAFGEEGSLLAVRRFDRVQTDGGAVVDGLAVPMRLHQEDCCQALGIAAGRKYEEGASSYFAKMIDLLRGHSSDAVSDVAQLWDMAVFNYLVGNCDAHAKNFSLLRSADWRCLRLAPAYDLVSTAVYPALDRILGMSIGGERHLDKATRINFEACAKSLSLSPKTMLRRLDDLCERVDDRLDGVAESVECKVVEDIRSQTRQRIVRLKG